MNELMTSDCAPGPEGDLRLVLEWNADQNAGQMTCWLLDEAFLLETGLPAPDRCRLTHRRWSLCGFGTDFPAALADLRSQAGIMAPAYVGRSDEDLTDSARGLRDFLKRLVPVEPVEPTRGGVP